MHTIFSGAECVKYAKEALVRSLPAEATRLTVLSRRTLLRSLPSCVLQILSDGTSNEYMFRIASGRVRVEKGDSSTPVGQGAVVNQLQEMQTFGEMSFLDRNASCANCIADSDDVEVFRVKKADLAKRLEENDALARDFYKHMAISVSRHARTLRPSAAALNTTSPFAQRELLLTFCR